MPNLGISFSPFADDKGANTNPRGPQVSPQEAIRVLSLRVPRVVGAGSPIPQALLNAPGGAAFGGGGNASMGGGQASMGGGQAPSGSGMGLEELLAMLFGQRRPAITTPSLPIDQSPGGGPTGGTFPPMVPGAGDRPAPQPSPAPPPKFTPIEPPAAPEPMPWDAPATPVAGVGPTSRDFMNIGGRRQA